MNTSRPRLRCEAALWALAALHFKNILNYTVQVIPERSIPPVMDIWIYSSRSCCAAYKVKGFGSACLSDRAAGSRHGDRWMSVAMPACMRGELADVFFKHAQKECLKRLKSLIVERRKRKKRST